MVLFQLFGSCIYFSSSGPGEQALPKWGEDCVYHVPGDLVLADWNSFRKIFVTALPLLRAAGPNLKLILSPLPRYVVAKCCQDLNHIRNFGKKTDVKQMGSTLADLRDWIDDLAHGKRLKNYKVSCTLSLLGALDGNKSDLKK